MQCAIYKSYSREVSDITVRYTTSELGSSPNSAGHFNGGNISKKAAKVSLQCRCAVLYSAGVQCSI